MQIIILGAGQVGCSLAASLVVDEHSVTVVDIDEAQLNDLQSHYDLRTVIGHCSHPSILNEAGADSADMIIAVTHSDEINIVACMVAATVFNVRLKMARVRAPDYFQAPGIFFAGNHSPVDVFVNPAELITHSLSQLIEYSGALRVFDFMDERIKLIATRVSADSAMLGKTPNQLYEYLPNITAKIVAIYRDNHPMPLNDTRISLNDDISLVVETGQIHTVLEVLCPDQPRQRRKRVMIIGGGYVGGHLARILEKNHHIKLIEQNRQRCKQLTRELNNTLILHGNGCDSNLLQNEDVENTDCFCALSNSDADNIVSSLHSKQLGAKQVIALINSDAYLSLIISGYIHLDIALSPQQITISGILKHLRQGNILQAYSLRRGAAEALEIKTPQDAEIITISSVQSRLPKGVEVGIIARDTQLIIPDKNTQIQPQDRVMMFISDKRQIPAIEKLFSGRGGV